jgi:hypothetical protein
MTLMCIGEGRYHLTKGKIYNAEFCLDCPSEVNPGKQVFDYYIVNDKGVRHGINKELFIDIVKVREDKLNELGI